MIQEAANLCLATPAAAMLLPTVVVVSQDGTEPAGLTPFLPRAVCRDLLSVRPSDDVVILYSERSADDIGRLHRMLGRNMPGILVAARTFDETDVIGAFDNGATSYLIMSETPEYCLVEAVVHTAGGENCLSPCVATVLLKHLNRPGVKPAPVAVPSGDLTGRERQVMELLVVGHTIAEIARHLRVTQKTVRNNLGNIYTKLQVRRQSEAILLWLGHQRTPGAKHERLPPQSHDRRLASTG
jgi:DNA-binding NarL/FixJ family response regulator